MYVWVLETTGRGEMETMTILRRRRANKTWVVI